MARIDIRAVRNLRKLSIHAGGFCVVHQKLYQLDSELTEIMDPDGEIVLGCPICVSEGEKLAKRKVKSLNASFVYCQAVPGCVEIAETECVKCNQDTCGKHFRGTICVQCSGDLEFANDLGDAC